MTSEEVTDSRFVDKLESRAREQSQKGHAVKRYACLYSVCTNLCVILQLVTLKLGRTKGLWDSNSWFS